MIKKIQMIPPGHTDINHPETDSTMVLMGDASTLETKMATKAILSTLLTSSLVAATWTGAAVPFSYVLAVAGVTATSNQEILPTTTITSTELLALQSANIVDGGQAAGNITLLAYGTKPTIAIPIRIVRRGDIA